MSNIKIKTADDIQTDFQKFREAVPLKKATLPNRDEIWSYYMMGHEDDPNNEVDPIVFVPGTTTHGECFFYQLDALNCKGYKVVSCQYPPYYSVEEWVQGFERFLDILKARKVHLFGTGLGGLLVQCYAVQYPRRVASLMLCNSFTSTVQFADHANPIVALVHVLPTIALRKALLDAFPPIESLDLRVRGANLWVAHRLEYGDSLDGYDMASRLTLTYNLATVGNIGIDSEKILVIDVNDECVIPQQVRWELRQRYPDAKTAMLKAGGDFPFLSSPTDVVLFIEVHLRRCGLYPMKEYFEQINAEQRRSNEVEGNHGAHATNDQFHSFEQSRSYHSATMHDGALGEATYKNASSGHLHTTSGEYRPTGAWKNPFEDL